MYLRAYCDWTFARPTVAALVGSFSPTLCKLSSDELTKYRLRGEVLAMGLTGGSKIPA